MRAIRVHTVGGPEQLVSETIPTPEAGAGEVLIQVETIGVNFIDCYFRSGLYPAQPPFTPGQEVAGVVVQVGAGVAEVKLGDRVVTAAAKGGYAEFAVASAHQVVRLPDPVPTRLAAAVWLQGLTAHYLAVDTFPVAAGHAVLVYAAAGGVGRLLVQIAKRRGARVLGVVGHADKAALARSAGADEVIVRGERPIADAARAFSGGRGVDVVFDAVGRATFEDSLRALRPRGMMVSFGNASGAVPPLEPLQLSRLGSLYLTRPTLADYVRTPEELQARAKDLFTWLSAGELDVGVGGQWPLGEAPAAHRALESGRTTGKLLLDPVVR